MSGILFDKKPLKVEPWHQNILYEKSSITVVPIWVKLPKLGLTYWNETTSSNIVGYLGTVLTVGNATLIKSRSIYARVLVEMNVSEGFPR